MIYIGMLPPATIGKRGGDTPAPPPVPVFSIQPPAYTTYQESSTLKASALAAPVTGYQWQRKVGSDWVDVAGATSAALNITATGDGTYRVKALNGASQAVSSEMAVYSVYMRIQNDSSPTNGSANGTTKVSDSVYSEDGPAGTRYYSAFFVLKSTDANFTPPDKSTARALAAWATTNAAVAPAATVSATGQLTSAIKTGSAVVTATYENLKSTLNVQVP